MLALAQSPLQQHYRELMETAFYTDDAGYFEAPATVSSYTASPAHLSWLRSAPTSTRPR